MAVKSAANDEVSMKNSLRIFGFAAIAALSVIALAQEGVTLKRVLKVGEVTRFRLKADFNYQSQDMSFSALIVDKVTKVAENGEYTVESTAGDNKIVVGGNEMALPGEKTTVTVFKGNGAVVDVKSDEANTLRLAQLHTFILPEKALKAGDTWENEVKADAKLKTPGVKTTYKVEAFEKVGALDTVRVKVTSKELSGDAPTSLEGSFWISTKDGSMVKGDAMMKNFPAAPEMIIDTKLHMSREDIKQ
jgi:hypothetical protein